MRKMETQGWTQWKEQIESLLEQGPQRAEPIAQALQVPQDEVLPVLEAMVEEGRLVKTRKERYARPETLGMIRGRLQGNARGFGFVVPESGEEDLFIPPDRMGGALHGDTVFARMTNAERREGEIARVLTHANDVVVGTFEQDGDATYVVPDEKRISMDVYVSRSDRAGARPDDKVVVRITQWPSRGRNPRGRVIENLGNKDDIGTDIKSLIRQHRLDEEFPQNVLGAAGRLRGAVQAGGLAGVRGQYGMFRQGGPQFARSQRVECVGVQHSRRPGTALAQQHIADVPGALPQAGPCQQDRVLACEPGAQGRRILGVDAAVRIGAAAAGAAFRRAGQHQLDHRLHAGQVDQSGPAPQRPLHTERGRAPVGHTARHREHTAVTAFVGIRPAFGQPLAHGGACDLLHLASSLPNLL